MSGFVVRGKDDGGEAWAVYERASVSGWRTQTAATESRDAATLFETSDEAARSAADFRERFTDVAIYAVADDGTETPIPSYGEALHDLAERTAERDALAATIERLIREAGAIRLDERQRAKAEHDSLADQGRARCERRCEELEDTIARMRRIIDDADRVKDENETLRRDLTSTRAELKALHDVLSGKRPLTK